jgi:hypothetical protein
VFLLLGQCDSLNRDCATHAECLAARHVQQLSRQSTTRSRIHLSMCLLAPGALSLIDTSPRGASLCRGGLTQLRCDVTFFASGLMATVSGGIMLPPPPVAIFPAWALLPSHRCEARPTR